jgi:Protein of unknown function (DUF3631)
MIRQQFWRGNAVLILIVAAQSSGLNHEDHEVTLLGHIRQVFDARGIDRIFSQILVEALVAMEGGAPWSEWRGKTGNLLPHPLTQAELANILHDFDIAPKSIWLPPRMSNSKSRKGYYRRHFEPAWNQYCRSGDVGPADELPPVPRSA